MFDTSTCTGSVHAAAVVSGGQRDDTGGTNMSPRLGFHDSSLLLSSSHL